MSNSDIRVFHYQGGSSDKVWAICSTKNQTSTFTVWYGRRGNKLGFKDVPAKQSADSRILEKLDKGYVELPDMTIDTDSCQLVKASKPLPANLIPSALWYRLSKPSLFDEVLDRIDAIEQALVDDWPFEAHHLKSLSLYNDLEQKMSSGSHELSGGPLGVLLLFSLRRHFSGPSLKSGKTSLIDVADDFSNLLPDRFDDLNDYIAESSASYFQHRGWMSESEYLIRGDDYVLEVARKHGFEHHTSVKSIKKLAIAMGCIDAPIDLSIIRPDQPSAFF